jgi:hypothetical protein
MTARPVLTDVPMNPFRRLPARYGAFVTPLILSGLMTLIVSGISTLRVLGPTPAFLQSWPGAWALSWLIAFPVLLLALPVARRLTAMLVAPAG